MIDWSWWPLSACCVHTEPYGTRTSMLIRVPDAGEPEVWASDGPSCVNPLVRVSF